MKKNFDTICWICLDIFAIPKYPLQWRWGAIAQQEAVATDFLRLGAGMSGAWAQANWADPFLCRFCGKICFGEYLIWILFYFIR
ncbi:hypothetical protein QL285_000273 [Trifolium repens]|nr:hypothetical protein QL285_000273 [Trifolium repens]